MVQRRLYVFSFRTFCFVLAQISFDFLGTEEFEEEDKRVKETITERNALENAIFEIKMLLDADESGDIDEEDAEALNEKVREVQEWLDDNPNPEVEELKDRRIDFTDEIEPIVQRIKIEEAKRRQAAEEEAEDEDDEGHDEL